MFSTHENFSKFVFQVQQLLTHVSRLIVQPARGITDARQKVFLLPNFKPPELLRETLVRMFVTLSSFRLEENTAFVEEVLKKYIFSAFCSICSMEVSVQRHHLKMPKSNQWFCFPYELFCDSIFYQ